MRVTGDIPNLINGVSQQAVALRLPTQGELQENGYSTVVEGQKKRPPAQVVAKIMNSAPAGAFFHIIDFDDEERYIAVLTASSIQVFDLAGNQKIVLTPNGLGYLAGVVNPALEFRALTVANYTFIVNRAAVVARSAFTWPARPREALINIKAGNYGKQYAVYVDNVLRAYYNTPDGTTNDIIGPSGTGSTQGTGGSAAGNIPSSDPLQGDVGLRPNQAVAPTEIAKRLWAQLKANLPSADWEIDIYANVIHLYRKNGANFSIAAIDGQDGNGMIAVKDVVQKFADLPRYGPQDFHIRVAGAVGTRADDYFVRSKQAASSIGQMDWRESPAPGTPLGLNFSTMPHVLIRNSNGTFTFKTAEWDDRESGDAINTTLDPSFVGHTIQDVFFHRNRLGFLADESVILSRAGSFFDFFRASATTLLDDDPIDVSATHIKISMLEHAVPYQDNLLLFSAETQFRLAGNELLTPKTVSIRAIAEYSSAIRAKPIVVGSSVWFASDFAVNGESAAVFELIYDKKLETVNAAESTAHVPSYIPAGAYKIVGSSDESCLAVLTRGDPTAMYVHRFYWDGDRKVQSSWSRWSFGGTVLQAEFLNSDIYAVIAYPDGVFIERIRMDTTAYDSALGFMANLDRRVQVNGVVSGGNTTLTLPYPASTAAVAVLTQAQGETPVGYTPRVLSATGNVLTIQGAYSGRPFIVGLPYEHRYRFSQFFPRVQNGQSAVVRQEGRTQLQRLSLVFDKAGVFDVEVRTDGRPMTVTKFRRLRVGDLDSRIGTVGLSRGSLNVPLMSAANRVSIDIVNRSWLPASFVSASWSGIWNAKGRNI